MEGIHLQSAKFRCRLTALLRKVEVESKVSSGVDDWEYINGKSSKEAKESVVPFPIPNKEHIDSILQCDILTKENNDLKNKNEKLIVEMLKKDNTIATMQDDLRKAISKYDAVVSESAQASHDYAGFEHYLKCMRNEADVLKEVVRMVESSFANTKVILEICL